MYRKIARQISARRLIAAVVVLLLLPLAGIAGLRGLSALQASSRIYSPEDVPERPVAIVFGAEVYRNGRLSAMLADRVTMGAELYHTGKVERLLFTGDNHIDTYNEPEAMRQYALSLGVPDEDIVLDYAGFRTYDSCYRARDIFRVESAILVTQDFHLDRALLVCNALGINSVGVAADGMQSERYSTRALLHSELREFPATALSLLDLMRNKQPTFLGEQLPIFQ